MPTRALVKKSNEETFILGIAHSVHWNFKNWLLFH